MVNRFLDFVLCGRAMCFEGCGRIAKILQDDDADLWSDLACSVPTPRPPPVPSVVQFPCTFGGDHEDDDDVSTLYFFNDPSALRMKHHTDDSLLLQVAIVEEDDDHETYPYPYAGNLQGISKRLFDMEDDDWGDGSSYSSGFMKQIPVPRTDLLPQHSISWHTDSTATTVQTQNHSYLSEQRN